MVNCGVSRITSSRASGRFILPFSRSAVGVNAISHRLF
jgi:hypothetical protein